MPATTAVIYFIGLILFSKDLSPSDQNLRAMIPRIAGPLGAARQTVKPTAAELAMAATKVEPHWGFIYFAASDFDAKASNWKPSPLPTMKDYLYVRLDGEQIRFITAKQNGNSKPPVDPGRRQQLSSSFAARFVQLSIPHLQHCCAEPALRPEYIGPDFRLAAAVFDLSNGRPQVCKGPGALGHERADTVVSFDNDGVLIIDAPNKHRQLVLKGSAAVIVGNMPPDFVGGPVWTGSPVSHATAWTALIDPAKVCKRRENCDENARPELPCEGTVNPTFTTEQRIWREGVSGGTTASTTTTDAHGTFSCANCRMDEQCSNTQWP